MGWKSWALGLFSIKYGALALLVLQNTFLVVFMRYSRTSDGPLYATSTAVVMMEVGYYSYLICCRNNQHCVQICKFVCCFFVILCEAGGIGKFITVLKNELTIIEIVKVSVPSLVYTVQNNLLYFALSHLDAATYQVCYQVNTFEILCSFLPSIISFDLQSKILTTAIFSVFLLNKQLSWLQ
jgi:solute carrier family 35 (UDP-sugar transporter), member A1/2/3